MLVSYFSESSHGKDGSRYFLCDIVAAILKDSENTAKLNEACTQIVVPTIKRVVRLNLMLTFSANYANIINGNLAIEAFKNI